MEETHLIDSPKRSSLIDSSTALRTVLKDWEKNFAASHDGRKPEKEDIKACAEIAKAYKEYNSVRDVLARRSNVSLPDETGGSPVHRRQEKTKQIINRESVARKSNERSVLLLTPRKQSRNRKETASHPNQIDPYDPPWSASPNRIVLNAIGPTPQRDGKVLGLFDLLSDSGLSPAKTPASKKRRSNGTFVRTCGELGAFDSHAIVQTPTTKRRRVDHGDTNSLEQHVGGEAYISDVHLRHSRTPASEGKRFMLSRFISTPIGMMFTSLADRIEEGAMDPNANENVDKYPLRAQVLQGQRDRHEGENSTELDATPSYLKRSYSFKERLLSASDSSSAVQGQPTAIHAMQAEFTSPCTVRTGPPTLRRYKSAPKPLSEIVRNLRKIEDERHDDDLDALRELESNQMNAISKDNQIPSDETSKEITEAPNGEQVPPKQWRKKGQKRTTKHSKMKPVKVKPRMENVRVALESGDESEDQLSKPSGMQPSPKAMRPTEPPSDGSFQLTATQSGHENEDFPSDEDFDFNTAEYDEGDDNDDLFDGKEDEVSQSEEQKKGRRSPKGVKGAIARATAKSKTKPSMPDGKESGVGAGKEKAKKAGKINPNAASHLNFRTLKIKNKNSRAKKAGGGGGRFGRRGR